MPKLHLFLVLLLPACQTGAQTLSVTPSHLSFDTVFTGTPDSILLTITNTLGHDVDVTGIRFYDIYGQPAFRAGRTSFTVADQSSETVWITFDPRHNIFHNSELVIANTSHRGSVTMDITGQGRFANAYYDSTENRSEEDLKQAIQSITGTGYVSLGYNVARDSMFMIIDNKLVNGQGATQNTIECIYTGRQAVGYTDRTDCQTNYSFNTEHTFPQGFFSSLEPMRSDLHHIFPTDDAANNVRANYPYGVVTSPTWQNGGSKYANGIFEPRDAQKGAAARALLYFVLRYQDYSGFVAPQESILRTWHSTFPPAAEEITRNNKIASMQMNRNPFIDYPVLADRIHSFTSLSLQPSLYSLDLSENQVDYGYVVSSVSHTYRFSIINNGNQPLILSGFMLNPPTMFSFANGTGANATVSPGEALDLDIVLSTPPSGAINGTLNFTTNVPGQISVIVPLHADGASPAGLNDTMKEQVMVYPNPVEQDLFVKMIPGMECPQVKDVTGRVVNVPVYPGSTEYSFDFSKIPRGLYILQWKQGSALSVVH